MNGAAIIFFAYLGYDAVATLAEEVRPMTSNASLYGNSKPACAACENYNGG